jgi:hypothetical protein
MDDLFIHIKLYTIKEGYMYCLARYNAQIYQQAYNVTKINESLLRLSYDNLFSSLYSTENSFSTLSAMSVTSGNIDNVRQNDNITENYTMSQDPLSVYATPQRNIAMRSVSNGTNIQPLHR